MTARTTAAEPNAVKMRSIPTNLGRLAVYDTGIPSRTDASSEVLVLWPSLLADHRIYNAQVAALRERYRLILIDGPGHGASGASTGSFSMAHCADAVVQVLEVLEIVQPVVCIGTSWGGLVAGAFTPGNAHITLRNVTATTTTIGASSGANLTLDGANLIMHSINPKQSGGADLAVDVATGSGATISLSHSNYASVNTTLSSGTNFSYTPPGTNANQTAPPLFVNPATGDVHELAASPTIDAGVSDPLIGATDLEGAARSQASCIGGAPAPDIGAYEFAPTAACPTPAAKPSSLFHFGKLKRNKKKGTASLAVLVPGPGTLTLTGKGIVKATATSRGVGVVKLAVKAKGKAAKMLRTKGKLKASVVVTYIPTGGDPDARAKRLKLIRRG